jgi:phospholipase C
MRFELAAVPYLGRIGRGSPAQTARPGLGAIDNIVVIFAENRSFDNLYGSFPGANGLKQADPRASRRGTATGPS